MARWLMVLPPVLFAGLAAIFYVGMYRDNPGELRSVLLGREAPVLLDMAERGIRVAGVNMMDDDAKAVAYLAEDGNPFLGVATDPNGRNRVEWGVTAPPETFILAGDGTVLFRFVGPLVGTDYEKRFVPELEKALAGQ